MPEGSLAAAKTSLRHCLVCESTAAKPVRPAFARPPWRLVACSQCGFCYVPQVPQQNPAQTQSPRRQSSLLSGCIGALTSWGLTKFAHLQPAGLLNRLGPAGGDVVDIGGNNSASAMFEISSRFSRHFIALPAPATPVAGLTRFADASLAGALLRSFQQHESDARLIMQLLSRKLRADGMAIIKLPNYGSLNRHVMGKNWRGFRSSDHVNYFRKRDMANLAAQFGMTAHFPLLLGLPTGNHFTAILRPKPRQEIY